MGAIWYIMHKKALAWKAVGPSLHEILLPVIKIINFIKTRPLKSKCFELMCENWELSIPLFFTITTTFAFHVGCIEKSIRTSKRTLLFFLLKKIIWKVVQNLSKIIILFLLYFKKLNLLNVLLQGNKTHILQLTDKFIAFKRKLIL